MSRHQEELRSCEIQMAFSHVKRSQTAALPVSDPARFSFLPFGDSGFKPTEKRESPKLVE